MKRTIFVVLILIVIIPSLIADEVSVPLRYTQKWGDSIGLSYNIFWLVEGFLTTAATGLIIYHYWPQSRPGDFGNYFWIPATLGIGTALSITVPLIAVSPPNKSSAMRSSFFGSALGWMVDYLSIVFVNLALKTRLW